MNHVTEEELEELVKDLAIKTEKFERANTLHDLVQAHLPACWVVSVAPWDSEDDDDIYGDFWNVGASLPHPIGTISPGVMKFRLPKTEELEVKASNLAKVLLNTVAAIDAENIEFFDQVEVTLEDGTSLSFPVVGSEEE